MERCLELGCDLFQGYFLRHPETVRVAHLPTSKLAALRLIGACQDPEASAQDVSATVSADLSMTYSLLRLANSALFGRSRPIRSVEAVVTWMGTEYLSRWGTLLALASERGCPVTYLGTALQRGYMCETLAAAQGDTPPGSSFLVGPAFHSGFHPRRADGADSRTGSPHRRYTRSAGTTRRRPRPAAGLHPGLRIGRYRCAQSQWASTAPCSTTPTGSRSIRRKPPCAS